MLGRCLMSGFLYPLFINNGNFTTVVQIVLQRDIRLFYILVDNVLLDHPRPFLLAYKQIHFLSFSYDFHQIEVNHRYI
jgi:hypothetical protein